jgi:hypothetical protein
MRVSIGLGCEARKRFFLKKEAKTFDYAEPSGAEEAEPSGTRRPNTRISS